MERVRAASVWERVRETERAPGARLAKSRGRELYRDVAVGFGEIKRGE
jgi:hypothetical protein